MTEHEFREDENVSLSARIETGLALEGDRPATAVLQHRRVRDRRYHWDANGGVDPPLSSVGDDSETPAGGLAVGQADTVTLSVPAGTLPPGRYLFQVALYHLGNRHLLPETPRQLKIIEAAV
jgi:hypothetical protein